MCLSTNLSFTTSRTRWVFNHRYGCTLDCSSLKNKTGAVRGEWFLMIQNRIIATMQRLKRYANEYVYNDLVSFFFLLFKYLCSYQNIATRCWKWVFWDATGFREIWFSFASWFPSAIRTHPIPLSLLINGRYMSSVAKAWQMP